jgi:multidrug efflux pump subunit AcrB
MKSFNLSEWAIKNRSFVWFFMLLFVVAGVLSYVELGREEDPTFSIKTMIVQTYWPGATIDDTMLQITDRILNAVTSGMVVTAVRDSQLAPAIAEVAKKLPADYTIEAGGTIEESAKGLNSIVAVFPLMIMLMLVILMVQLQSFQKVFLVISVAPLGLIGVVLALLPTGTPMGFVAILGIIALSGMIIRNSVILIDQIDMDIARGLHAWDAVIDATTHRMRPIVLTAAAASLGMIPIASEVFWGPMAYAIIGGLIVATLLTLLFLPALYVAWFRIKEPAKEQQVGAKEPAHAVAL